MQRELWSFTAHAWPCSESLTLLAKFSSHPALTSYLLCDTSYLIPETNLSLAISRLKLKIESKSQHIQHGSMQVNPCYFSDSSSLEDSHESPSLALFFLVSQLPGGKATLNLPTCFTLVHPAALSSSQTAVLYVWGYEIVMYLLPKKWDGSSLQSLWSLGEPEMLHGTRCMWGNMGAETPAQKDQTPKGVQMTLQSIRISEEMSLMLWPENWGSGIYSAAVATKCQK